MASHRRSVSTVACDSAGDAAALLPIIAFGNIGWNALWMNRQHLLSRFAARGHAVAYSNGTAHYSQFGKLPWSAACEWRDGVLQIPQRFYPPRTDSLTALSRFSMARHAHMIRHALGVTPGTPHVGMCFDPNLLDYIDALAPPLRAFHIYDAYNRMDLSLHDFTALRRRIGAYDLITASSDHMYEDVVGHPPEPRFVVPNGVDFDAMRAGQNAPSETAARIRALPGPRIGYVGSINTKLHFELVRALAVARPDASFVMVGPVRTTLLRRHAEEYRACTTLQALPNVHFFDQVPREQVPAVVNAMDINCLFFRIDRDDWVAACYPLKLHEYLAIGKPVLSTAIKVVREQFSSVIDVCDDLPQWLAAIARAEAARDDAEAIASRRAVAAENDWNIRAAQFGALLADTARAKFTRT